MSEFDRRAALAGLLGLAATGAGAARRQPPKAGTAPAPRVPACPAAAAIDATADRLLALLPETAVYAGAPGTRDGGSAARRLEDYSPAGEAALADAVRAGEARLAAAACPGDAAGARHLAIARAVLGNAAASADIHYGRNNPFHFAGHVPYVVNPLSGPHIDTLTALSDQQSVATPAAVDAWLAKLDDFPRAFAGVVEKMRADADGGCRPPRALAARVLPALDAFLRAPARRHPLILGFRRRMAEAQLDRRLRARAEARAVLLLQRRARPAFAKLRAAVAEQARGGRDEAGVWAQAEGEALYAANVRALGDTDLAPDAIHRLGLDEAARVAAALEARLAAQGFTRGTMAERLAAGLAAHPEFVYPATPAGKARLLAYVRGRIAAAEALCPRLLPPALIPQAALDVRPVAKANEATAPTGFNDSPALDGSRPGIFWINLGDMAAVSRWTLPTLAFHEGVPGHHLQGAVAQLADAAPLLVRIASFNAFSEGWALYAEALAAEMGLYADDPWGDIGRLHDELLRAARLVVDTGLHHLRWSRERAIGEMRRLTGNPYTAEVDRYMAWPGQALGYKLGQLRITAAREAMRGRAGAAFDLRAFHAAVLADGARPLAMVEAAVAAA